MTKKFSPEKIRAAAKDLQKTSDGLDDQIDDFLNEIREVGDIAGDAEMIGELLGASYEAAEEKLIVALESVVERFEWFAESLFAMADEDEQSEQTNTETVKSVGV